MSSPSSNPLPPHPKPWEEKNPLIAGLLAILIPGAGHFYQGRMLKAVIYSVSILGLVLWANKLGEGVVIYNMPDKFGVGGLKRVALSYVAQFGTGLIAMPPLIQNRRAEVETNRPSSLLAKPLTAEFVGQLTPSEEPDTGRLVGTVKLDVFEGQYGREMGGTFSGKLDGEPAEFKLGGQFWLDMPIKAGFRRMLTCGVVDGDPGANGAGRKIVGTIPRSIIDAYGSPPDEKQLQELNGRLGKLYELALVFTWIAGLLNVLAFFDCICGPAYGFGDEHLGTPLAESSAGSAPRNEPPRGDSPSTEPLRPESRPAQKAPV